MGKTVAVEAEIRDATETDVAGVAAIYEREVREGYATFETEPPPPERWTSKLASAHPGDHFLVASDEVGRVLGYAYSGSYRERAAYSNSREVSVYVAPEASGRGVGRGLYDELIARMRAAGVHTALGGVALPNPASEALHRACGFELVGVKREVGRKFGRWIDVAWYQLML